MTEPENEDVSFEVEKYKRMLDNISEQDCKKNCSSEKSCKSFVHDKVTNQCFILSRGDGNELIKDSWLAVNENRDFTKKSRGKKYYFH